MRRLQFSGGLSPPRGAVLGVIVKFKPCFSRVIEEARALHVDDQLSNQATIARTDIPEPGMNMVRPVWDMQLHMPY